MSSSGKFASSYAEVRRSTTWSNPGMRANVGEELLEVVEVGQHDRCAGVLHRARVRPISGPPIGTVAMVGAERVGVLERGVLSDDRRDPNQRSHGSEYRANRASDQETAEN